MGGLVAGILPFRPKKGILKIRFKVLNRTFNGELK